MNFKVSSSALYSRLVNASKVLANKNVLPILDCFLFDVYGYGHGCGMSQWGAVGYARNGWGYQDILRHYFTGTTVGYVSP